MPITTTSPFRRHSFAAAMLLGLLTAPWSEAQTPGTLDTLNLKLTGSPVVRATAPQPDGKLIIVGRFSCVLGPARGQSARVNTDGTLDMSFDVRANGGVNCVAVQPDGKIVFGGNFFTVQSNGGSVISRVGLARVNPDGSPDMTFDPRLSATGGAFASGLALQP